MGNSLSYAKEVYYHFRDEHGEAKVVPVRGVYVTGEFKPPMYFEPILRLLEVNANHPTIEDYIETSYTQTVSSSHHLYDMDLNTTFRVDEYTTGKIDDQKISTTHHLFDFDLDTTFHTEDFYTTSIPNQTMSTTHHLFDFDLDPTYSAIDYTRIIAGSQPEPMLRMIEFDTNTSTITDET